MPLDEGAEDRGSRKDGAKATEAKRLSEAAYPHPADCCAPYLQSRLADYGYILPMGLASAIGALVRAMDVLMLYWWSTDLTVVEICLLPIPREDAPDVHAGTVT